MRHMLAQFGPCLKWPWTKLEAPELTDALIDRMVEGTQAQAGGRSIRELERLRDDYLVAIQQVLRQFDIGAGSTLRALEERLYRDAAAGATSAAAGGAAAPLRLVDAVVRPEWVDYNAHMTDFRYPQLFGEAMDALYRSVGHRRCVPQGRTHVLHRRNATSAYAREAKVGRTALRDHPDARRRRQAAARLSPPAQAERRRSHRDRRADASARGQRGRQGRAGRRGGAHGARSDSRCACGSSPAAGSGPAGSACRRRRFRAVPKIVDHAKRRDEIAQVACQVVAAHGFEHATVARIARAAGYTTGMVAHYFDSKQEIILAALRLMLTRIEARLTKRHERGADDLVSVLCEALPLDEQRFTECAFWMAFWGQVPADKKLRRLNAWVHREYMRLYGRCFARALAGIVRAGRSPLARPGAQVRGDVHQWPDGERGHESRAIGRPRRRSRSCGCSSICCARGPRRKPSRAAAAG